MRLARGVPLKISLAVGGNEAIVPAARLAMSERIAQLEWSPEVIAQNLNLAGLYYPPEPGLHAARNMEFDGLHGFLADSLPDGWGTLLMQKRLAKLGIELASLDAAERLALVGETGRGALVFEPSTTPSDDVETLDLDALAEESITILSGDEGKLGDTLAKLAGGSGGARPKINIGFDSKGNASAGAGQIAPGHTAWIVKFRAEEDPVDIGPIEFAYAEMAELAGLEITERKLLPAKRGGGYFATRRFDRPAPGQRRHMISLSGAIESYSQTPSSYDTLLRATRAITRNTDDVVKAFRRMVFNVLSHNRDDHTRQHAFLMDGEGVWTIAPSYDLTYSPGPRLEHYLDIDGEGRNPTRAHVEKLGRAHGLSDKQITAIIDDVRAAVSDWRKIAKQSNVSPTSAKTIADAHARVSRGF